MKKVKTKKLATKDTEEKQRSQRKIWGKQVTKIRRKPQRIFGIVVQRAEKIGSGESGHPLQAGTGRVIGKARAKPFQHRVSEGRRGTVGKIG